jgi:hypothetical protein
VLGCGIWKRSRNASTVHAQFYREAQALKKSKSVEKKTSEAVRNFVGNIQLRARNNAFAHKVAAENARKWGSLVTYLNLTTTSSALFFTSLSLATTKISAEIELWKANISFSDFSNIIGIASAFIALLTQCILLYKRYDTTEVMHIYFQDSFQYISQKSRKVFRPGVTDDDIFSLVDELENQFALLKARAIEPSDKDFEKAAAIQNKVAASSLYEGARTDDLIGRS